MSKQKNNTALKVIITLFIVFFAIVAGYEYFQYGSVFNNAEHYRKIYSEALTLKNNEEYSQAFAKLENISPRYEAYDAVLYIQAQCAAKAGDEASAQKRLKSLINKYPQSYLYIPAKYDLAKSYLRSGDKNLAADMFQNIINSHSGTDYETGSYYYLGDLNSPKSPQQALKFWKKYIYQSQDGRFSADCANSIISSGTKLSAEDNFYLGLVFFKAKNFDEAAKYLYLAAPQKAWYYLASIAIERKNIPQAKELLYKGLAEYSEEFSKEDLTNIIYSYTNLFANSQNIWNELSEIKQPKIEDVILFNLAKYAPADKADEMYKKITDTYIKGDYGSEALKKLFWSAYKGGNYKLAKDYAAKHIATFSSTKSAPEMNYWLGKVCEKENDKEGALKAYNRILAKYPDDYYAMRAFGRISYLTKGKDYGWHVNPAGSINQEQFELKLPYSYAEIKTKFGATLAELLSVEDFNTIEYFNDFKEPFIESWIYYKKGLRSTATTTARNAMEEYTDKPFRTDNKWKFVYPCYFMAEINKYSERNNISPYLMIALIREESYFNPLALSGSNAVGLSQILPSTAREVSERRGYGIINEFLLFNPETNIKFGSAYFAQLKKQMNDSNLYAVASYNGGAGAVSSWIKRINTDDLDEFVEFIPYEETKNYVKKVFRSYWNYVRLYGEK